MIPEIQFVKFKYRAICKVQILNTLFGFFGYIFMINLIITISILGFDKKYTNDLKPSYVYSLSLQKI